MFKKIVGLGFQTHWKNKKDAVKYIKELVDGWATEFFTGYNPAYWSDKFGFEVSPNGRFAEHEQITDFDTLKIIVEEVHNHGLELFINLNAWYYTDVTFPLIQKMVKEFEEAGVDGIICWNISIIEYLKEIWFKGKINLSTILALYNTESIKFFLDEYDINKVILSREVTLPEIEKLVTAFPEVKFEVFGEWDFCRYNNGLCYAEHKYWTRDICTIVVNDLIVKKRFKPDFKKLILDETKDSFEKLTLLNDEYRDSFEQIEDLIQEKELGIEDEAFLTKLEKLVKKTADRVDLFYDPLKSPIDERNKKILTFLKWVKVLNENGSDYNNVEEELTIQIKKAMTFYSSKIKEMWWVSNVKANEVWNFYNRNNNLNLHTYLFFSKFKNIETVKFPTRWRSATKRLDLITEVVNSKNIPENIIDISDTIERCHYDMEYLFGEKNWFRNMIREI